MKSLHHLLRSESLLPCSASLEHLLCHRGLLTSALSHLFGREVNIQLLDQSTLAHGAFGRRILIRCLKTPLVYAETMASATTLSYFPWLANLGDRPLGANLVKSSEFSITEVFLPGLSEALKHLPALPRVR